VKKIVLATALLALGSASAFAADLPARTYTKASVAGPAYNWSGFYFGANAGYGFKDRTVNYSSNNDVGQVLIFPFGTTDFLPQPPTALNSRGAVGGAQIGYNWQFDTRWLVGLEADFDASAIQGSGTNNYRVLGNAAAAISADQAVEWFGTVRARLGFVPIERLLVFGTAGLAYGRVTEAVTVSVPAGIAVGSGDGSREQCLASLNPCMVGSSSRTNIGWSAGGGVEYALGSSVTAKLEYLHVDLGSDVVRVLGRHPGNGIPASANADYSTDFNIVRAGVNYRF
jgi:outer membrane immunogenic protein